jgi:hypothetical protein
MGRFLWRGLVVALLAAGCGRQAGQDAVRKDVQHLMEKQLGQKLNASSPLRLAEVKDKLRRGMPIGDFDRVIAERNKGPHESTKVMSHALVEGEPPKANPKKAVRTYYLRDGDLIVVTELVGAEAEPQEQVISWRIEPLDED